MVLDGNKQINRAYLTGDVLQAKATKSKTQNDEQNTRTHKATPV